MKRTIVELMRVPSEQHDPSWLKDSLQAAIELELATLPPYFCGLWSIKAQSGPAYDLIHDVVMEEMLHMGLACNMLNTIGGAPQINTVGAVPTYPGPLPGGVRPELTVYLAGLSKDYLKDVFMEIEYPEAGPVALALGETFPTIGAFYDAILEAFKQLSPTMTGNKQIISQVDGNALFGITSLADVEKAINEIKEQGEGTSQSPFATDFGGELAHYYKYAELYHEHTLIEKDGKFQYIGDKIDFPNKSDLYDMSPIPKEGYPNPSAEVAQALRAFDAQYTTVLNHLQDAWSSQKGDLGKAVGAMFGLQPLAAALLQMPLPDGSGVYGPDFLLVS